MLTPTGETLAVGLHLDAFAKHGFSRLGPVLHEDAAVALGARADELMNSDTPCPGMLFQHDAPTGRYEDLKSGAGCVGAWYKRHG